MPARRTLSCCWARWARSVLSGLPRTLPSIVKSAALRANLSLIHISVGPKTLGRIWNVMGKPVDGKPMPEVEEFYPIHHAAPRCDERTTKTEIFETGIKAFDLLEPYIRGGKTGLFGGAGVGKTRCV